MKGCRELKILKVLTIIILLLGIVIIDGVVPLRVQGKGYNKTIIIDPNKEFIYNYKIHYFKKGQQSLVIDKLYKIDDLGGFYQNIGWVDDEVIGLTKRNSPEHFENTQQVSLPYWQINVMNIESRGSSILIPNSGKSQEMGIISPDKKKIVFTEVLEGEAKDEQLIVYDIYKKNKDLIKYFKPMCWSKDSRYILGYKNSGGICSLFAYDIITKNISEHSLDYKKFKNMMSIVTSSDNKTLYFTSSLEDGSNKCELYKIKMKDGNILEEDPVSIMDNELSCFDILENGGIIFAGEINGDKALYIYKPKDSSVRKIVDNVFGNFQMSPDEKYIAFYSNCNTGGIELYATKLYKNKVGVPTLIYKFDNITSMYWSNDNKKLMISEFDSKQKQDITSIIYFKE